MMCSSLSHAQALGWKVLSCGGILPILAFCLCTTSETADTLWPQAGNVRDFLIPRPRDHYLSGFLLLALVGAC